MIPQTHSSRGCRFDPRWQTRNPPSSFLPTVFAQFIKHYDKHDFRRFDLVIGRKRQLTLAANANHHHMMDECPLFPRSLVPQILKRVLPCLSGRVRGLRFFVELLSGPSGAWIVTTGSRPHVRRKIIEHACAVNEAAVSLPDWKYPETSTKRKDPHLNNYILSQ